MWAENFPERKGVRQIGKIYSSKGQAMLDNGLKTKSLYMILLNTPFKMTLQVLQIQNH
ncbi:MAG: hypothetical protein CM15mP102_18180 [Flavobacteriales bacterium]|nr:MAG: hypothetical protein CM15mP102_18180 [Flavobacteriales bacterium]